MTDMLTQYAESELRRAGYYDADSDYGGMIGPAVVEIIRVFSDQGHSGFSAGIVTRLVERLMRYEPLTPLTGEPDEWMEYGHDKFQNKRCSHVFKDGVDGQAYDIEGFIFREPSGACFTNRDSRRLVEFPYTPKREYIDVPERTP